ncbi:hypothetical protein [Chitinophaga rhizophila]|uniref:Uncharacterized protein n=1 Tax=Chitinophaga rhizophila TaxID=2866212 RepID=A0ABS7GKM0_9BACT|nr:hypothetical protein [Chitinophaga rhizophila]MBW8687735.1 hypothetical protein [Chitinophaga rhizophila]
MSHTLSAQRLDAIGKEKPLKITGGLGLEQIAYWSSGLGDGRRDPYNFFLNGNLNIDLYGWSVPFSFNYSNQSNIAFSQPFNQYGLTPTYKWITGHIGYSSMNFSSYTLAGHLFNGIGVDLAPPGRFKFSVMYGRLQKSVEADTLRSDIIPAYRRMGYGFKAGYSTGKDNIEVMLFRGKDDENSIRPLPEIYTLTPQENIAMGLNVSKQVFKRLLFNAEVAVSALTRDTRAATDSAGTVKVPTAGLISSNSSTALYSAYKAGLGYNGDHYTLGIGYEWVAPEYKTLGAYYFTNDFENITGNLQVRMLKDRMTAAVNAGVQRNNLNNDKLSTMRRFVGAVNIGMAATKKLNLNLSYSNFQSFVNIRSEFDYLNQLTPYENLDTLNYTQLSSNATAGFNYNLSRSKEKMQMLVCNLSYMQSSDKQGGVKQASGAAFYNLNTSYNLQLIPKQMSVMAGFNANRSSSTEMSSLTLGPTIGVNKTILEKKMRLSGTVSWNSSYTNGENTSRILTARAGSAYTIRKVHSLNLNIIALDRTNTRGSSRNVSELTTTLGYNYNF